MPPGSRGKMARRNEVLRERFEERTGVYSEDEARRREGQMFGSAWDELAAEERLRNESQQFEVVPVGPIFTDRETAFKRTLARAELLLQDGSYDYGMVGADGILVVLGEVCRLGAAEYSASYFGMGSKQIRALFTTLFVRENAARLARAMSGDLEVARDFWILFEVALEKDRQRRQRRQFASPVAAAPKTPGPRRVDLD